LTLKPKRNSVNIIASTVKAGKERAFEGARELNKHAYIADMNPILGIWGIYAPMKIFML